MSKNKQERMEFIEHNHSDMTAYEIADALQITVDRVYGISRELGVKTKTDPRVYKKINKQPPTIQRPDAIYNNIPSPYGIWDMLRGLKLATR